MTSSPRLTSTTTQKSITRHFENFKLGGDVERERLLVENTLDAVRDLQQKAGDGFDGEALASDILAEFAEVQDA